MFLQQYTFFLGQQFCTLFQYCMGLKNADNTGEVKAKLHVPKR